MSRQIILELCYLGLVAIVTGYLGWKWKNIAQKDRFWKRTLILLFITTMLKIVSILFGLN